MQEKATGEAPDRSKTWRARVGQEPELTWASRICRDQVNATGVEPDAVLLLMALNAAAVAGPAAFARLPDGELVYGGVQAILVDQGPEQKLARRLVASNARGIQTLAGHTATHAPTRLARARVQSNEEAIARMEGQLADLRNDLKEAESTIRRTKQARQSCGDELGAVTRQKEMMERELARRIEDQVVARMQAHPMLVVSFVGPEEVTAFRAQNLDGALYEVVIEPDLPARFELLSGRALRRVAAFRRAGPGAGIHGLNVRSNCIFSSLWVLSDEQLGTLRDHTALAALGVTKPMVLIRAGRTEERYQPPAEPTPDYWATLTNIMLRRRLLFEHAEYVLSPGAVKAWGEWKAQLEDLVTDPWVRTQVAESLVVQVALGVATMWEVSKGGGEEWRLEPYKELVNGDQKVLVDSDLRLAMRLLEAVDWKGMCAAPRKQESDGGDEEQEALGKLLHKLGRHGPCTMRTLVRAYDDQNYERIGALLEKALTAGLAEERDGFYRLSGSWGSKPRQCVSASVKTKT
jgi:hypothetical protein